LQKKFHVNDKEDKKIILESLGKKWRDNRARMFAECYKKTYTWEQNLEERYEGVPLDQWASFLQYKLSEKGKVIINCCKMILKVLSLMGLFPTCTCSFDDFFSCLD
jgi:hypothetical protein